MMMLQIKKCISAHTAPKSLKLVKHLRNTRSWYTYPILRLLTHKTLLMNLVRILQILVLQLLPKLKRLPRLSQQCPTRNDYVVGILKVFHLRTTHSGFSFEYCSTSTSIVFILNNVNNLT